MVILTVASVTFAVSVVGAMLASGELGYLRGGAEKFVRQRLAIGNREELGADVSASSRSHLAMHAIELFGDDRVASEWRTASDSMRLQIQRLIRDANKLVNGGYLGLLSDSARRSSIDQG